MVLVCIVSRWAGGWAVGPSRNRALALQALDRLKAALMAWGRDLAGCIIHHDQDSVYTSQAWLRRVLVEEHGRLSYAEHGAKDNPWIESFWGRFKTEHQAELLEAETLDELSAFMERTIPYYNTARRHSALAYKRPQEVLLASINKEKIHPGP